VTTIRVIGEGMLELSRSGSAWNLGYGGDTTGPDPVKTAL